MAGKIIADTIEASASQISLNVGNTSVITATANAISFPATSQRITGDFSNATVANRVLFQTSTANGSTQLSAIPNGTGTQSGLFCYDVSDTVNNSFAAIRAVSATDVRLQSGITGTGTYLPMTFFTGGSERMRIDTSGNVGIGLNSPSSVNPNSTYAIVTSVTRADQSLTLGSYYQLGVEGYSFIKSSQVGNPSNATDLRFFNGATENARIDYNGNFKFNSGYGSAATAYGCRAWVNFNGTGTVAIRSSGNVTSITDGGTGIYTVNFTTAMPDVNYAAVVTVPSFTTATTSVCTGGIREGAFSTDQLTTSYKMAVHRSNGTDIDQETITFSVFR